LSHYANVVPSQDANSRVPGVVFALTTAELLAADGYERDAAYARTVMTLASGVDAWVYATR
jgi:hypothetical protein